MAGIALPSRRRIPFQRATGALAGPGSERVILWIGASLLFVTAVLNFYVFQVSVVATSAYELQSLERERDAWRARNQQLRLELAKAQSLRWIEFEAVQHLGMVAGQDRIYLRVEPPRENAINQELPRQGPQPSVSKENEFAADDEANVGSDEGPADPSTRSFWSWLPFFGGN